MAVTGQQCLGRSGFASSPGFATSFPPDSSCPLGRESCGSATSSMGWIRFRSLWSLAWCAKGRVVQSRWLAVVNQEL